MESNERKQIEGNNEPINVCMLQTNYFVQQSLLFKCFSNRKYEEHCGNDPYDDLQKTVPKNRKALFEFTQNHAEKFLNKTVGPKSTKLLNRNSNRASTEQTPEA